jgi:hypothetical protein
VSSEYAVDERRAAANWVCARLGIMRQRELIEAVVLALKVGTSISKLLNVAPWLTIVKFSNGQTLRDLARAHGRYYAEGEILYFIVNKLYRLKCITDL